jgi:hypothetical protein
VVRRHPPRGVTGRDVSDFPTSDWCQRRRSGAGRETGRDRHAVRSAGTGSRGYRKCMRNLENDPGRLSRATDDRSVPCGGLRGTFREPPWTELSVRADGPHGPHDWAGHVGCLRRAGDRPARRLLSGSPMQRSQPGACLGLRQVSMPVPPGSYPVRGRRRCGRILGRRPGRRARTGQRPLPSPICLSDDDRRQCHQGDASPSRPSSEAWVLARR